MANLSELNKLKDYLEPTPIDIDRDLEEFKKSIDTEILRKSKSGGSINPPQGIYEPDPTFFRWSINARGIRERFFNLSFEVLRDIAQKVGPIASIHNLRSMQIRNAARISYNDDELGFVVKLKDRKRTPDKKEQKIAEEIGQFILYSGYIDFPEAEERKDHLVGMNEMMVREILTIDQVAITPRRNRKGEMIDYWLLDGTTIKKTVKKTGYLGDKEIKYVQEIDSKITETFTEEEMVFYCSNMRADIRKRDYGYSFIEMCIDIITSWLFGMSYNKEFFNTSSQPKGILTFDGQNLDRKDLEELQREWISMFRGIKGMWKTPFLQYNAKWQSIAPSNRDMEFNQYIQMLASWIFAIHGTDSQELGIRLVQSQNVMNENADKKIAFSHDRGLKYIMSNLCEVYNKVLAKQNKDKEWDKFIIEPAGLEARNQTEEVAIDDKRVKSYLLIDELRAEKDLPPLPDGEGKIILDPTFLQARQMKIQQDQMSQQQSQQEQFGNDKKEENEEPQFEINEEELEKSKKEYITIII